MKLKTAVISVVVSASLVAGAGYGAYYAMQGNKSPVEVVPVSNVNYGYWGGMIDSMFGSVTSQVAQTVQLNEEYTIDKIYVEAGDEVKEGDPLFSYDMTLQELELEMSELSLQTQELTMTKLEKDLEKLKNTRATASLESRDMTMTASSSENTPERSVAAEDGTRMALEEASGDTRGTKASGAVLTTASLDDAVIDESAGGENGAEDSGASSGGDAGETASGTESTETAADTSGEAQGVGTQDGADASAAGGSSETDGAQDGAGLDGFRVEDVEEVASDSSDEELALVNSVVSYERLVLAIDALFGAYGDDLRADEIGDAIEEAVVYYRKNLADETVTPQESADGSAGEARTYVLKDSVRAALGEEETAKLETIVEKLAEYQVRCVEMRIRDASRDASSDASQLSAALNAVQESYDLLDTKQQGEVGNMDVWQELKAQAERQDAAGGGQPSESGEASSEGEQPSESGAASTDSEQLPEDGSESSKNGAADPAGTPGETVVDEAVQDGAYGADAAESEQQSETETGTEAETYTVTVIDPARGTEASVLTYQAGETVLLDAVTDDPTRTFERWEAELSEWPDTEAWNSLADWNLSSVSFEMPARSFTVRAVYTDNMAQIDEFIDTFIGMAETVLSDGAKEAMEADGRDYVTELESAVIFYQQWLAELPEEILSTTYAQAQMSQYQLRQNVESYLTANSREVQAQEMKDYYKQLCIRFVRASFDRLDPQALVREELEKTAEAYALLGDEWRAQLEEEWQADQAAAAGTSSSGETSGEQEDESEDMQQSVSAPTIGDLLAVYNVYLLFQEYQQMSPDETEENRYAALVQVQQAYLALTDTQKLLAAQNTALVEELTKYGLWEEPQSEPETEPGDWGGDDWGGFDDGLGYTASELKELIEEKEQEIKECALDIRQAELELKQQQRIVDGKVVKSTLDGTVVSIGTEDGDSEDDYFVKVTNETGLYAKGSMNELALEQIHVGDTISGMMTSTGVSFTAVVKEISQYPDPNGGNSFGTENTNASYYPFYAEIENPEDIEEGEAEIQLSDTLSTSDDGIYLENYFVRTENDGRTYVFMQGEDGKLMKQYVTTRKTSYSTQILSGLEPTDKIAFPYGKNVQEGAQTKEVDSLSDAYM